MVDLMREVGKPLDPWQCLAVVDALGLRADGYWSAFETALLVSRQNGKGGFTEAIELGGLFLFGDEIIMHSAHLFKTAKQSFQRLVDIINGSDWLTRRVKRIIRARGDEEIELMPKYGGGRLLYFSRTGGAGRGFTGDKTIFDECAYLTVEQYQAATPTLATVPNPQIYYTGTPPDEDVGPMPDDAMMPSVRRRGHQGGERIALLEWSPPDAFDAADPQVWAQCNPSLGIRIKPWFLAQQLENFTAAGHPEKFATEHLGLWPDEGGPQWSVVSEEQWEAASDPDGKALDPVAFSVDVTPERSHACIAAVGLRSDGDLHGEIVDHRPGTDWVVPRLAKLIADWRPCAVSVVGTAAAFTLYPAITAELVAMHSLLEVKIMNTREIAAAYGLTVDALKVKPGQVAEVVDGEPVKAQRLRWRPNQYTAVLTEAVKAGVPRSIGEGTAWDRASSAANISPLVALTNAAHTFVSTEVPAPVAVVNPASRSAGASMFRPTGRLKL